MKTGHSPVETERMQSILDGNYPRQRTLRPEISPELDEVVMRALSLRPEDRFADAREPVMPDFGLPA